MFKEFLIKALGPDEREATPTTKFYEDRIKNQIFSSGMDKLITDTFRRILNKKEFTLDDVDRAIESNKANSTEFINKLFSDPSTKIPLAYGLLGNFRDKLSDEYLRKIQEILIKDPHGFLTLVYFDNNPVKPSDVDETQLKTIQNCLAYTDIMKSKIGEPRDDFKKIEDLLVEKGSDEDQAIYYRILFTAGKIPGREELRKDKYKTLNLRQDRKKHGEDEHTLAKLLNNLMLSDESNLEYHRTELRSALYKFFSNSKDYTEAARIDLLNKVINIYKVLTDNLDTVKKAEEEFKNNMNRVFTDTDINRNINFASMKNKIIKAYTRYYIKNFLPNLVRQASPETMPVIVENGVQEVQNLLYGDNHIMDFNNQDIRNQIKTDITDAVNNKDLLGGGASDGMSTEDIAKKWSEIYKIPYQQMLDIINTQEKAGSIVEQEHTGNLEVAKEIARDHLVEAPDYYAHLENMEESFPSENISVKPLPEPENMDLKTLDNPLPKDHVCDGSCGGNCQCNHDKVQTVEDKLSNLGDDIIITVISEPEEIQPLNDNEVKVVDYINNIAANIKR